MKALVQHYLSQNMDYIVDNSYLHCHVGHLHSIKFSEDVRMFIAEPGHQLWRNNKLNSPELAFHPHRRNITLYCIAGQLNNIVVELDVNGREFFRYKYYSHIKDGIGGFQHDGIDRIAHVYTKPISSDTYEIMTAQRLHSVSCLRDNVTAWFVFEGNPDLDYEPYAWSNEQLEEINMSNLYIKPSEKDIIDLLKLIKYD